MTWDYFPDGKLAARSDDGVPVGLHEVLVDNSDIQNVSFTGAWATADTADALFGFDYATSAPGTGADTAEWTLHIPADGSYDVFARWPQITGAATDTITHDGGTTPVTVDQTAQAGQWVSLGSFSFQTGDDNAITLTDDANGTVAADAVKLVRDNSGETDTENKDLTYAYDMNGNLVEIADNSPGADVDAYQVSHDGLNRVAQVEELLSGVVKNTTSFTYNQVGAPLTRTHDDRFAEFAYDVRNLLTTVSNGDTTSDPDPKVTTYTHTPRGQRATETKANGNTVTFDYWPDGALREQVETKPDATVVASHLYEYDLNGNRAVDTSRQMDADDHGSYLERMSEFSYDPRDRLDRIIEQLTDGAITRKTYDPLDRTTSQTTNADSPETETTVFTYVGLSEQVLTEQVNGQITTTYQHGPGGELLSQTKHDPSGGADEDSFYGYNPHGDIVAITDEAGESRATYGYTAYGSDDDSLFTGVDKPDPGNPEEQEPYNAYRYAGQRFDRGTGTYDMGFRDYDPGLNRFLTRDALNGAVADLYLTTNPWTLSRYTYAGGNPYHPHRTRRPCTAL